MRGAKFINVKSDIFCTLQNSRGKRACERLMPLLYHRLTPPKSLLNASELICFIGAPEFLCFCPRTLTEPTCSAMEAALLSISPRSLVLPPPYLDCRHEFGRIWRVGYRRSFWISDRSCTKQTNSIQRGFAFIKLKRFLLISKQQITLAFSCMIPRLPSRFSLVCLLLLSCFVTQRCVVSRYTSTPSV